MPTVQDGALNCREIAIGLGEFSWAATTGRPLKGSHQFGSRLIPRWLDASRTERRTGIIISTCGDPDGRDHCNTAFPCYRVMIHKADEASFCDQRRHPRTLLVACKGRKGGLRDCSWIAPLVGKAIPIGKNWVSEKTFSRESILVPRRGITT